MQLDRHFSLFSQRYSIDSLGWDVQGSRRVAYIEKAWPALHDRYRLEVANPDEAFTALCVVLAIDVEAERHN